MNIPFLPSAFFTSKRFLLTLSMLLSTLILVEIVMPYYAVAKLYVDPAHVDNPYAGAQGYINPDWVAEVQKAATTKGGALGAQMMQVANYSTAIWLDRIAAVTGGPGIKRSL